MAHAPAPSVIQYAAGHLGGHYKPGATCVWYMRPSFFRDGIIGHAFLKNAGRLPEPELIGNLEKTHTCVGCLSADDLDDVFQAMQGENWSPNGEASKYIKELGLSHTSMSVGDIIQKDSAYWMVDSTGFERL